ncbi:MAG: BON domain-containing protein [Egibacteraceae bacterium]
MRKSAMTAAMREQAEQAVDRLRQAELEQRAADLAAKARAKSAELSAKAQPVVEELTAKAQATGTKLATRAQRRGVAFADRGLGRIGERLAHGPLAQRLGIQPAKRGVPWPLVGALGIAIGYVIGLLTAPKREAESNADIEAHAVWAAQPLAEEIRAQIASDPRTSALPDIKVDVANGTVFVRGTVPRDFDQDTLREVVEGVPGVHDVDLQLTNA